MKMNNNFVIDFNNMHNEIQLNDYLTDVAHRLSKSLYPKYQSPTQLQELKHFVSEGDVSKLTEYVKSNLDIIPPREYTYEDIKDRGMTLAEADTYLKVKNRKARMLYTPCDDPNYDWFRRVEYLTYKSLTINAISQMYDRDTWLVTIVYNYVTDKVMDKGISMLSDSDYALIISKVKDLLKFVNYYESKKYFILNKDGLHCMNDNNDNILPATTAMNSDGSLMNLDTAYFIKHKQVNDSYFEYLSFIYYDGNDYYLNYKDKVPLANYDIYAKDLISKEVSLVTLQYFRLNALRIIKRNKFLRDNLNIISNIEGSYYMDNDKQLFLPEELLDNIYTLTGE